MQNLNSSRPDKLIIIGASTGGPGHIQKIITALRNSSNIAVVVAQHMDAVYIPSFVKLLNSNCALEVYEAHERTRLQGSSVYICSSSCILKKEGSAITLLPEQTGHGSYNPNINLLFESAAALTHEVQIMGMILTGIGEDGAKGCLSLAESGGECLAESEESAVVYGMPKRAYELNRKITVKSLDGIIDTIRRFGA